MTTFLPQAPPGANVGQYGATMTTCGERIPPGSTVVGAGVPNTDGRRLVNIGRLSVMVRETREQRIGDEMSMKVEILGPLSRGEAFHVHAAGCADIARRADYRGIRRERGGAWTMDATTEREVVEDVYSDFLGEHSEHPEYTWESYAGDIRFFPCCNLS